MTDFLFICLGLLILTLIGTSILRGFSLLKEFTLLELVPFSYGLGFGLIAFQLYIYSRFGIAWNLQLILLPWIMLSLALFAKKDRQAPFFNKIKFTKLSKIDKILATLIVVLVLYVGFEAIVRPVTGWDALAIWLLKSKIFFIDGYINPQILNYVLSSYPLYISAGTAFLYLIIGHVNDRMILLAFYAFYLAIGGTFFVAIRRYLSTTWSLLFTFLLLSLQSLVRQGGRYQVGYADLPLSYYIFVCSLLLFEYIKNKNWKILFLLQIFLIITANIKNEGLVFSFLLQIFLIIFCVLHEKYRHVLFSLIWFVNIIEWYFFKSRNNVQTVFILNKQFLHTDKFLSILLHFIREMLNFSNWNLLWIVFIFITIFCFLYIKKKKEVFFYVVFFAQLTVYFMVYAFNIAGYIPATSFDRLLLQLTPLAVYITGIFSSNIIQKTNLPKWIK